MVPEVELSVPNAEHGSATNRLCPTCGSGGMHFNLVGIYETEWKLMDGDKPGSTRELMVNG